MQRPLPATSLTFSVRAEGWAADRRVRDCQSTANYLVGHRASISLRISSAQRTAPVFALQELRPQSESRACELRPRSVILRIFGITLASMSGISCNDAVP